MSRLSVKAAVCTDIGSNRTNNEDNYYLNGKYVEAEDDGAASSAFMPSQSQGVFAVFDGMGGQSRGEFASLCAAKTLNIYKDRILRDGTRRVNEYIDDVNDKICEEMKKSDERIGSTAVILTVEDGEAQIYNLGDSRAYYIHKGKIYLISRDHTVAEQLYRMKMLTKEEAVTDVRKHRLTKHLGIFPSEMHLRAFASGRIRMVNGDMFLLCSDGVTNAVSERELKNIVMSTGDKCKRTVNTIVERAVENGSDDNITAMLVRVISTWGIKPKRKRDRHPRLYPFLLGVGFSALIFTIIVIIILYRFMG